MAKEKKQKLNKKQLCKELLLKKVADEKILDTLIEAYIKEGHPRAFAMKRAVFTWDWQKKEMKRTKKK